MTSYEEIAHAGEQALRGLEGAGEHVLDALKKFLHTLDVARVASLGLSTVLREILHGLGDLIGGELRQLLAILQEPPPDPAKVRDLVGAFTSYSTDLEHHHEDLVQAGKSLNEQAWDDVGSTEQPAGAARGSLDALASRTDTLDASGRQVATTLDGFADQMDAARRDYRAAREEFDSVGSLDKIIDNAPTWPWDWPGYLGDVFHKLEHAILGMLQAHNQAHEAGSQAQGKIREAEDKVLLPDRTSANMDVFASINQSSAEGRGPLREGVQERADEMIARMSEPDQAKVEDLLATARSDEERAWILSAAAAGHDAATLGNFANRLKQMTPAQVAQLDPKQYSDQNPVSGTETRANQPGRTSPITKPPFRQPDGTTCGSSSLVMAKMINDPVYAMQIMTGYDAKTGAQDPRSGTSPRKTEGTYTDAGPYTQTMDEPSAAQRFAEAAQQMHDVTSSPVDRDGDAQFPWLNRFGTAPWGAAHEMGAQGGAGVPGHSYDWHASSSENKDEQFQAVAAAARHGESLPLYVGGSYPQHVVLVTGSHGDTLDVYEPGSGHTYQITRAEFTGQKPLSPDVFNSESAKVWGTVVPR